MHTHRFPLFVRRILRAVLPALLLAAPAAVEAVETGPYSLEILVDGIPLNEYASRNASYIEALEGREYAVRLRNHTGRRIAVALSVDGLNTIDAKRSSARAASKWILGPHETITLEGWQTGTSTARRFFFTTEEQSYGAWLGETRNLGLISAAVFREKLPNPTPIYRHGRENEAPSGKKGRRSRLGAGDAPEAAKEQRSTAGIEAAPAPADDLAATGIGREVDHQVRRVRFEAERRPAAVLELRYEYRDALVRLGVLPRWSSDRDDPLGRRERSRGFDGFDFAPDPYR